MLERNIIFLAPGILGSKMARIKDNGKIDRIIYPGSLKDYFQNVMNDDDFYELSTNPNLKAVDIIRTTHGQNVYKSLIEFLEKCGYYEHSIDSISIDDSLKQHKKYANRFYVFPYDWRQSAIITTQQLSAVMEHLCVCEKANHNKLKITFIGHSHGGLVMRAYIESRNVPGINDIYKPFVKKFIGIAVPHYGSLNALEAIKGRHKAEFMSREQISTLSNKTEFPIMYQLLPNSDDFIKTHLPHLPNQSSIKHSKKFHQLLCPNRHVNLTQYYFIIGNGTKTLVGEAKSRTFNAHKSTSNPEEEVIMPVNMTIDNEGTQVGKLYNVKSSALNSIIFGSTITDKEELDHGKIYKYDGDGCVRHLDFNTFDNVNTISVTTKKSHKYLFKSNELLEQIANILNDKF